MGKGGEGGILSKYIEIFAFLDRSDSALRFRALLKFEGLKSYLPRCIKN
jgi:hypothetical protein